MSERRYAALDTRFLLALDSGDEACQASVDWLMKQNVFCLVTSVVVQELNDLVDNAAENWQRQSAKSALSQIPVWGFLDARLRPTDNGIAHIVAERLIQENAIPSEHLNDALVVTEAAFHDCVLLVTTRTELLKADANSLGLALVESHLTAVRVVHPKSIEKFSSRGD